MLQKLKSRFDLKHDKNLNFSIYCLLGVFILGMGILFLNSDITNSKDNLNPSSVKPGDFIWGVYSNAYFGNGPDDGFVKEHTDQQIPFFKDLGVNTVKFSLLFDKSSANPIFPENDYYVDSLIKNNIDRYMVIENGVDDDFLQTADYQMGYDWGKTVASHFKGKINYYQMLNEVSGTAMKPNFPGYNKNDYDEKNYQGIKNYLKGMSDAISEFDPGAQKVITAHFLGTAMIDRLIADGVKFDVIGWDWYSNMGDTLSKKEYAGQVFNIPEHFKNSGKKFWISELNQSDGSFGSKEQEQSNYLQMVMKDAIDSKLVSGIFVFMMFDSTSAYNGIADNNNSWGLVGNKKNPDTNDWIFDNKKPAYFMYQEMIRSHSSI